MKRILTILTLTALLTTSALASGLPTASIQDPGMNGGRTMTSVRADDTGAGEAMNFEAGRAAVMNEKAPFYMRVIAWMILFQNGQTAMQLGNK